MASKSNRPAKREGEKEEKPMTTALAPTNGNGIRKVNPKFGWGMEILDPITREEADALHYGDRVTRLRRHSEACQAIDNFKSDYIRVHVDEVRSTLDMIPLNQGRSDPVLVEGQLLTIYGNAIHSRDQFCKLVFNCSYSLVRKLVYPNHADAEAQALPESSAPSTPNHVVDNYSSPLQQHDESEEDQEEEESDSPREAPEAEIVTHEVADVVVAPDEAPADPRPKPTTESVAEGMRAKWNGEIATAGELERQIGLQCLWESLNYDWSPLLVKVSDATLQNGLENILHRMGVTDAWKIRRIRSLISDDFNNKRKKRSKKSEKKESQKKEGAEGSAPSSIAEGIAQAKAILAERGIE